MIKRPVKQEQNDAVCYSEPYILSLALIFFFYKVGMFGLGPETPPSFSKKRPLSNVAIPIT